MNFNPKTTQQVSKKKKPFGLELSCKIASKVLKSSTPASIVLYNLLKLQKETIFPHNLDEQFFQRPVQATHDNDKRLVAFLLDEIKKPLVSVPDLLEKSLSEGWVIKKTAPVPEQKKKVTFNKVKKTNTPHNKTSEKAKVKVEPIVIIKKNKLGN